MTLLTEYNGERPHDYLGGQTPASWYHALRRAYPSRLPTQEDPGHYPVRTVTMAGAVRFRHRPLYFNTALLARPDERDGIVRG